MKNKLKIPLFFWFLRGLFVLTAFNFISCTPRKLKVRAGHDHAFPIGLDEALYKIPDIIKIWDGELHTDGTKTESHGADNPLSNQSFENFYEKDSLIEDKVSMDSLLKIRTAKKGIKAKVSSSQENIYIDPEISFIRQYWFLDYTVATKRHTAWTKHLAKLLGKTERFKGLPNTDYYILPKIEGNYLILYKAGRPHTIPYDELFMARRVGHLLAVPLVGYPIKYCRAILLHNASREQTRKHRPLCEAVSETEAQYILLRKNTQKEFEYLSKPDLFRRDFLKGKWFFVRTELKSPHRTKSGLLDSVKHNSFKTAHLVEFQPALGKLDVLDAHDFKSTDKMRSLFIPVKWVSYEITRDLESLHPSFSERLKKGYDNDHNYFAIQFDKLIENEFGHVGGKALKQVIITKNYLSFNVEITNKGLPTYSLKYAFKRYTENPNYKQKQWFKEDSLLFFPVFNVVKKYHPDLADHTEADQNRFKRLVRFDPRSDEIRWHFSKKTSKEKWIRDLGHEAIALLNNAFQMAGRCAKQENGKCKASQIKLVPGEEDQELGDTRYNILNLILRENEKPEQFSLGNNIANPLTGEIISATVNVWVNHILNEYVDILRKYVRLQIWPPAWKFSSESKGITDFLHEKIENTAACKDIKTFIEKNKDRAFHPDTERLPPLNDGEKIKSCAKDLAHAKILQSIVHSMLHSLGQKDVFSASADKDNFYKTYKEMENLFGTNTMQSFFKRNLFIKNSKVHPHPPQYSSVMDEMNIEDPILAVPGKLDIAALRFIYFDQVELKKETEQQKKSTCQREAPTVGVAVNETNPPHSSCQQEGKCFACLNEGRCFLKIPSGVNEENPYNLSQSIKGYAQSKGWKKEELKIYKVCGWDSISDSFCHTKKEDDYGVNPFEVVQNHISKLNNSILRDRNRYDSDKITHKTFAMSSYVGHFYRRWKTYRDNMLKQKGTPILEYSFLNPHHIEDYKQIIAEEARSNCEFRSYYQLRDLLFNYFTRLIFLPVKHCVYKDTNGTYHAVAMENIEQEIKNLYPVNSGQVFINCQSPTVKKWAKDKGILVAEVGFFGKNRNYFLRPNSKDKNQIDEISIFKSLVPKIIGFITTSFNNMLEEPDLAHEYYQKMWDYILWGTSFNSYIDESQDYLDIPRNREGRPDLPNFLSYKIDMETPLNINTEMLYIARQYSIWAPSTYKYKMLSEFSLYPPLIDRLKALHANENNSQLLSSHFDYQSVPFAQLRDDVDLVQRDPELYSKANPFLIQMYEHWADNESLQDATSFVEFIRSHLATIFKIHDQEPILLLPLADGENYLIAQLFRKFNEFLECIDKDKSQEEICANKEDKKAFIKFMLQNY